jgi:hypothetical protein
LILGGLGGCHGVAWGGKRVVNTEPFKKKKKEKEKKKKKEK